MKAGSEKGISWINQLEWIFACLFWWEKSSLSYFSISCQRENIWNFFPLQILWDENLKPVKEETTVRTLNSDSSQDDFGVSFVNNPLLNSTNKFIQRDQQMKAIEN